VKANNIAYAGLVEENRVGTRTTFDVLQGQQDLFGSEVSLVNAQHDEAVSSYQIKAVIGELTAEQIGLRVKLYNPQAHYDAVKNKWIGTTPKRSDFLQALRPLRPGKLRLAITGLSIGVELPPGLECIPGVIWDVGN